MLEERAPASLVFFRLLANAENLPMAALVHADRNQQRDVAHLSGPSTSFAANRSGGMSFSPRLPRAARTWRSLRLSFTLRRTMVSPCCVVSSDFATTEGGRLRRQSAPPV